MAHLRREDTASKISILTLMLTPTLLALTLALTPDGSATAQSGTLPSVVKVATPLTRLTEVTALPRHLAESVSALALDPSAWTALAAEPHVLVEQVPLGPNHSASLVLHRVDPFALSPTMVSATRDENGRIIETALAPPALDCYIGSVINDPDSRALLSRGEGFVSGYVIANGRTWIISSGPAAAGGPIVSYAMDEVPPGTFPAVPFTCESILAPDAVQPSDGGIAFVEPCRQGRVAVETDSEFLSLFGGNQATAMGYVGTLFAALADIYSRDVNYRPGLAYLRLWATPDDPWFSTSTSAMLYEFRDYWYFGMSMIERDGAHFLSGRGLGGGVAWLNAGCGEYAYAVSANLGGSFPYPLVDNSGSNWDIMVVAHELGHNYGAPHTHNYSPPADGCGSSPQDCSAADADIGTIMSYCHTCSGGMTNIQLRFHTQSITSIGAYLHTGVCPFSSLVAGPLAFPDRASAIPGTVSLIDVLANDLRFNCEALTLVSVSQPATGTGIVSIAPGAGPDGRDVVRLTSTQTQAITLVFTYTIREESGAEHTAAVTVDLKPMRIPENPIGDTPGITTNYYVLSAPSVLPDFTTLTPYLSTTLSQVNIESTSGDFATSGRADQVGAVFIGWINVPSSGAWTLFTNSDDGSRLLIGTTVVVMNDGLHGMQERSGTIDLAAGRHAITMEFFENGGGAGMISSWQGPQVAKAVIPPSALTHGGSVNPADINHDGSINGLDLTEVLSAWGSNNPGADLDDDGVVGGADLTLILAGWTG